MNILVTGAAGFIGSFVSRALISRGDNVVGIDNFNDYYARQCKEFNVDLINIWANSKPQFVTTDLENLEQVSKTISTYYQNSSATIGSFKFLEVDITAYESLDKVFKENEFDAVIHLAAMAGVPLSTKKPRLYANVNVDGTVNLLNLCAQTNVRKFVFGSSSSVYGNRDDKKVTEDDDVTKPVSVYGASKVAGEVLVHSFTRIFHINAVVVRIFGPIYGPLQRPYGMFHQRAINYAFNNKSLQIYGQNGLSTAKDSTYIDDEVAGILKCLDTDYKYEIFNIGTSNPLPISTWIDTVERAFGKSLAYEIVEVDKGDVVSSASIDKARNLLNYNPSTDMYQGVARQVEVFKLMPKWYQEMEV